MRIKMTAETLSDIIEGMDYYGRGRYLIRGAQGEMRESLDVLPALRPQIPVRAVHRVYSYPCTLGLTGIPAPMEALKLWDVTGELPKTIRTDGKLRDGAYSLWLAR